MSPHTPGPWTVNFQGICAKRKAQGAEDKHTVLFFYSPQPDMGDDEWIANGKLVAAAPELLACLIECEEMLDEFDSNSMRTLRIRSAIAKATGGQP